ncbi:MAG: 2-hydroxychromene-2-carboxylate isomerase [Porticoccaceae bacterium]|nr:2-hydroxychromene-2-carboxylate isomerase [Porticoccaceae bacterium]MDG1307098.1 2-hydroxychromene-2-carboxylate isomerase [Porticoccaceae bacterium]
MRVNGPDVAIINVRGIPMAQTIEFYFDFGSPTAYLAHKRLQQLKVQYACSLDYKPVLLGGLFKASGNTSPVTVPAKGRYMMSQDLPRFAALYEVPLTVNPHFPINTLNLMRGAVSTQGREDFDSYVETVFNAIWVNGDNMGDPDVVANVLTNAGLDATKIMASTQEAEVKSKLISNTEAAVARGCFGAPTMFVGDNMFFGQDRMQFIEMLL